MAKRIRESRAVCNPMAWPDRIELTVFDVPEILMLVQCRTGEFATYATHDKQKIEVCRVDGVIRRVGVDDVG